MADASLLVGFVLIVFGVALLWGAGWACLVAGVVIFAAGGAAHRQQSK